MPKSPNAFDQETWRQLVAKLRLPRQQARVAELMLLDRSNKEIADVMNIAEPTVCTYVSRLLAGLGVDTRLAFALRLVALVREGWHLSAGVDVIGDDDIRLDVIEPHAFESRRAR